NLEINALLQGAASEISQNLLEFRNTGLLQHHFVRAAHVCRQSAIVHVVSTLHVPPKRPSPEERIHFHLYLYDFRRQITPVIVLQRQVEKRFHLCHIIPFGPALRLPPLRHPPVRPPARGLRRSLLLAPHPLHRLE